MKTAEEILREYVSFNDVNGNETVELLPLTIVDAMEEYAQQVVKNCNIPTVISSVCDCPIPFPDVNNKYCLTCRLPILH